MSRLLFEDIFEVLIKDPDKKSFDKVSRFKCRSDLYEMDLLIDINVDVYPMEVGEKYSLALSSTLTLDGTPTEPLYNAAMQSTRSTLMDNYDYVMFGRIFKYKDAPSQGQVRVDVFISFGGLLMQLTGDPSKLEELAVDSQVYLLMRKV
ncbi:hypothetical protein WJX81_004500 [Elliptochloris bilobata]|uniref:DNA-directed RNA polymerases I, II, and III subunit RPABC3 n=1 Tax=Elliptochloris bilobata TaxID=381761 RepID=A0AAW1RII7_9CHLO